MAATGAREQDRIGSFFGPNVCCLESRTNLLAGEAEVAAGETLLRCGRMITWLNNKLDAGRAALRFSRIFGELFESRVSETSLKAPFRFPLDPSVDCRRIPDHKGPSR